MGMTIAVSGKGGTGKTTLAALITRYLISRGEGPILAVDADANSNLHQVLGVEVGKTIGEIRERITAGAEDIPTGVDKHTMVEYQIQEALVESKDFDLISMGRGEGPGCYCYLNSVLRTFLDRLCDDYEYVVVDNEAGMEHLSRRTTRDMDVMLVVSDPSLRGVETAARIRDLAGELELAIGRIILVIARLRGEIPEGLYGVIEDHGLKLGGVVPEDEAVMEYDLDGRALLELPDGVPAVQAVDRLMEEVFLGVKG